MASQLDPQIVLGTPDLAPAGRHLARAHLSNHRVANRPHIKTHKIPELGKLQMLAGAVGITCQKLGEVEVFTDAGVADDVLLAFNILGEAKLERLMALCKRLRRLAVVIDNEVVARGLSAVGVRHGADIRFPVECDTGLGRNGVQTPQLFRRPGIPVPIVSGGGTPAIFSVDKFPMLTEHRAGTDVYNDVMTVASSTASWSDCAMRVRTTVVSRPTDTRAVIDAGSKVLSSDQYNVQCYGLSLAKTRPRALDNLPSIHCSLRVELVARTTSCLDLKRSADGHRIQKFESTPRRSDLQASIASPRQSTVMTTFPRACPIST